MSLPFGRWGLPDRSNPKHSGQGVPTLGKVRGLTMPVLCMLQPFNVLRYQLGQHYDAHYDVFDPESYGPQSSQRVSKPRSILVKSFYLGLQSQCQSISALRHEHALQARLLHRLQ